MGDELSKSQSNVLKSESNSLSNSGDQGKLEEINFLKENKNTIINRVWIVKRSISLSDGHVDALYLNFLPSFEKYFKDFNLIRPKQNVFKLKNEFKSHFKQWAMLLELSNGSYINIQFAKTGFALKEFNVTKIPGENILNAILETWGEDGHPFSFCYLGNANYDYENLKLILLIKKGGEIKSYEENGKTYYNVGFLNCQHFACDLELILFGLIKTWHSFNYYLLEFFKKFFPNINIKLLKQKYEADLFKKNNKLYISNIEKIKKKRMEIYQQMIGEEQKILYYNKLNWLIDKVGDIFSPIIYDY